ncbi:hypothetical protein BCR37DRAFT_391478 [Protomyces lactucae-debilis]|uniref:OTU domain-containing protein n=1 Tax=Protomyces lactucae-debilis TaxID=2754530 RepID=A0A1Y2FP18_PROLT|nr:uncharacterized protein BCR37DRAFT_391478 [Protomyces lactucae-debilis]ORY85718.1 hypothetical protein BCR37DRAFT_391478 [Protomyces lactucae-debilis]
MGKQDHARRGKQKKQVHSYTPDDADMGMRQLSHQLASQSLYIKDIAGDGNCLFRSLADQLGESEMTHAQIRHEVVEYLRKHPDTYAAFVEEDFDTYLDRMAQDGVYGDNLEIVGFANVFKRHVKIYQPDMAYVVSPDETAGGDMLHIAYHSWEHYSSVRNKDGPHDGPPCIKAQAVSIPPLETRPTDAPASDLEKICLASVPGATLERVRQVMDDCKGKVNDAVEILLDEQAQADVNDALQEHEAEVHSELETQTESLPEIVEKQETKPPPKRLSARDRKEQAKKAQKQAALDRKRLKKTTQPIKTDSAVEGIKTMYI